MNIKSNQIVFGISILCVVVSLFLSFNVISVAKKNQEYKIEAAEVNSIIYGLLDANEWKNHLSVIITNKIEAFELTPENRDQLKTEVENLLYKMLDEVDEIIKNDMNRIKSFLMNAFVDLEKLRDNVPELSLTLLEELEKPENKANLREYILGKLDNYVDETFNNDEQLRLNRILEKYDSANKELASEQLQQLSNKSQKDLNKNVILLIFILLVVFIVHFFWVKKEPKMSLFFLLAVALVFLLNGISIPMIDIEAEISQITFQLMGENIVFNNQVLFFQSKSILDVVWILISTEKFDMVIVGILIFTFSILFPVSKMACSFISIQYPQKYKSNKWITFFTYKSGKWSMADVFVVAIFMAFIGFSGIINDQLSHLDNVNESVEVVTQNGTFLQPGFYLFLLFCLTGLFLGDKIQKIILN